MPLALQTSSTHLRRSRVELVASRMPTIPPERNQASMSATAASAAARRFRSPSGLFMSKKSALG